MEKSNELSEALSILLRTEVRYLECGEKCSAMNARKEQVSAQVVHLKAQSEAAVPLRRGIIEKLLYHPTAQTELDRHNDEQVRNERELKDLIELEAMAALACKEADEQRYAVSKEVRRAEEQHKKMIFATRVAAIIEVCQESLEELALAALDTATGGEHPQHRARKLIAETLFPASAFSFDEVRRQRVVCRMRNENAPSKAA